MSIAKVVRIVKLGEQKPDSVYWRTRPPEERLAALEQIRREYHGWKEGEEPRIEKVVTIIKMKDLGKRDGD
jgi:hypothetical protein